jgi:hypothetical protein
MSDKPRTPRWGPILRYTVGAAVALLIVIAANNGFPWYFAGVLLLGTIFLTLGRRRIFRPAVTRSDNEILCRFAPWYESNAYLVNLALPIIALSSLYAGLVPGNPMWLRVNGIILLLVSPLFSIVTIRNSRRCFLRITPTTLTARLPRGDAIDISRESIRSVTPSSTPNGLGGAWPQTEITYQATTSSGSSEVETIQLGLQLTIKPPDLLRALATWNDTTDRDPDEVLNRAERILRGGRSPGE